MPMFCPECGSRLDADMVFCPECGTRVEHEPADDMESPALKGILFTHIPRLARKLSVDPQEIIHLLTSFMQQKAEQGVFYQLANAGAVASKGLFSRSKSLAQDAPWHEYADVLKQIHDEEAERGEEPGLPGCGHRPEGKDRLLELSISARTRRGAMLRGAFSSLHRKGFRGMMEWT